MRKRREKRSGAWLSDRLLVGAEHKKDKQEADFFSISQKKNRKIITKCSPMTRFCDKQLDAFICARISALEIDKTIARRSLSLP